MDWPAVLWQWSLDPSVLAGVGLAALLYLRGRARLAVVRGDRAVPAGRWKAASFFGGLLMVVVALESPIDALSAGLFTFHMVQHLLLIMAAAPLLLLGDPVVTLTRGVPLGVRRTILRVASRRGFLHRAGRWLDRLMSPGWAFGIFLGDLYLWHWSRLFNLTLQNDAVHLLEHLCFLGTAILFWSQVIDQRTLPARLAYAPRAVYLVITAFASNLLAMYFVFTPRPVYSAYAALSHRPYGMTALGDQQIAGAVMWVPVLFLFGGAFAVCLYKALDTEAYHDSGVPLGAAPYSMFTSDVESAVSDPMHG
jgi:cytochrome c oxidase assembly factor CtaG